MGYKTGKFLFNECDKKILYKYISDGILDKYCFIQLKTEYFPMFFDIDFNEEEAKEINFNSFWTELIIMIERLIKKYTSIENIELIYSDRKDKNYKLHLYFPDIIVDRKFMIVFSQILREEITKQFNMPIERVKKNIDNSVYLQNGLRLLYQYKKGEKFYYEINKEKSTKRIENFNKEELLKITELQTNFKEYNFKIKEDFFKIEEKEEKNMVKKLSEEELKSKIENKINNCKYKEEDIIKILDLLNIKRFDDFQYWKQFIYMCKNYGLNKIAHEYSSKSNKYKFEEVERMLNTNSNFENVITFKTLYKWAIEDNFTEFLILTKEIKIDFKNDGIEDIEEQKYIFNYDEKINVQYLDKSMYDIEKYNCFLIKSGTGSNKTGSIIETIKEITKKEKINIFCITSRIVLASNIYNRFLEAGITDMKYYGNEKEIITQNNLCICVDSLVKFIEHKNKQKSKDIIFIDEIESLMNHICVSSTLKNKNKIVYNIVKEWIKKAKYVFVSDSNISNFVVKKIISWRKEKTRIIYNEKKTSKNNYNIFFDEACLIKNIIEDLENNKNIFICSDSIQKTEILYRLLQKYITKSEMLLYNSDCDYEIINNIINCNYEWTKKRVILCSPSILYGVDFSPKIPHIHKVYGIYSSGVLNAKAIYQQSNRVRDIIDKEINIFLEMKVFRKFLPITDKKIKENFFKNLKTLEEEASILNISCEDTYKFEDDERMEMYLHFKKNNNKSLNDIIRYLKKYCTEFSTGNFNISCEKLTKEEKDEINTEKKEIKGIIYDKKIKNILKCDEWMIKNDIYILDLYNKKNLTKMDKNCIIQDKIKRNMNMNKLDYNILSLFNKFAYDTENFSNSIYLFANEDYRKEFLTNSQNKYNQDKAFYVVKKNYIENLTKIFLDDDNLLTNNKLYINSDEELTKEQIIWYNDNIGNIKDVFNISGIPKMKHKKINLFRLFKKICLNYFGGVLKLNINQTKKNNGILYYECSVDNKKYIELILNRGCNIIDLCPLKNIKQKKFCLEKSILQQIKINYNDVECDYNNIHNNKKIDDFFKSLNTFEF